MTEQLQQEPPQVRTSPYQSPMYNFGSSILLLTDPSNNLHELELTLRGLKEDENGNLRQITEPMMNEKGINSVLGIVARCLIARNTVMSNLDKSEVRAITLLIAEALSKDLMINRINYGIGSTDSKSLIFHTIIANIYITLKRPQDEGEKRFLRGSVQEIKTTVDSSQQKKGIFGRMFGW